ncbi:BTB POZ domain containing [Pyrenophora seminiperda CCB06]|uniref:BTB POZ domain containing n=1 Tax=Pyrenophora seminiperda CCB06 TaxID=1302712 RepID=A0A3M7M7Z0_9PLEO|nr:BTB POZ domain containing [Pyrenophora seminiperda CCB06]
MQNRLSPPACSPKEAQLIIALDKSFVAAGAILVFPAFTKRLYKYLGISDCDDSIRRANRIRTRISFHLTVLVHASFEQSTAETLRSYPSYFVAASKFTDHSVVQLDSEREEKAMMPRKKVSVRETKGSLHQSLEERKSMDLRERSYVRIGGYLRTNEARARALRQSLRTDHKHIYILSSKFCLPHPSTPQPSTSSAKAMAPPKPVRVSKSSMASHDFSAAVTIRVGKDSDQKDFIVHESFLTSRSDFFRRAMNGNWDEAKTRIINLPDDKPDIFAYYINFVYTNQMSTATKEDDEIKKLEHLQFRDDMKNQCIVLCSVYVLAEKLQDAKTKNGAMKVLWALYNTEGKEGFAKVPHFSTVKLVYDGTPPKSLARHFLVYVWSTVPFDCLLNCAKGMCKDFREDLGQFIESIRPFQKREITRWEKLEVYLEKEEEA